MRFHKQWSAPVFALALISCRPQLEYPVPAQKVMPPGEEPLLSRLVNMADSGSDTYVVSDVLRSAPDAPWRWTNQQPRLQVKLDPQAAWTFKARFVTPKVVLDRTGPLTVTFFVNDEKLGQATYAADRSNDFRAVVPAEVLKRKDPVVFGMDVDKAYVAADGVKLCLLLQEIGFEESVAK